MFKMLVCQYAISPGQALEAPGVSGLLLLGLSRQRCGHLTG